MNNDQYVSLAYLFICCPYLLRLCAAPPLGVPYIAFDACTGDFAFPKRRKLHTTIEQRSVRYSCLRLTRTTPCQHPEVMPSHTVGGRFSRQKRTRTRAALQVRPKPPPQHWSRQLMFCAVLPFGKACRFRILTVTTSSWTKSTNYRSLQSFLHARQVLSASSTFYYHPQV